MGRAVGAEREEQRLLGRGLADRAGDADDAGACPPARRAAGRFERAEHVVHREQGRAFRHLADAAALDDAERRAAIRRRADIGVAVAVVAAYGEEHVARPQRAGVDGDAADGARRRAGQRPAGGGGERVGRPERLDGGHHVHPSSTATAVSRSENGNVRSPTIWPVS